MLEGQLNTERHLYTVYVYTLIFCVSDSVNDARFVVAGVEYAIWPDG